MAQHRKTSRTARRVAAIGGITALGLTLAAGTASAGGGDERCERADGVVVCLPADVDLSDLDVDVNILNHQDDDGYWLPVHGPDLR